LKQTDLNAFKRVRIVLVGTTHPGNIGAAARAMKNMYLSRLYLVAPERYPSAEATSRASGADDILAQAVVCDNLEQALTGASMVFGASARLRRVEWAQVDARECGTRVASHAAEEGEVALVFGREHSGLTNAELERCNYLVHIPSNPDYSSLNLGAAVQVLAYEVAMAMGAGRERAVSPRERPVTADELERMYAHLEQTLVDIDFLDPENPGQLMRRLRRLFNRCGLEQTEVNILRGIFTAATKQARQ
jgi:tRNA (cytidine32/uridine32-2'-O)-methyltransferase